MTFFVNEAHTESLSPNAPSFEPRDGERAFKRLRTRL